MTNEDLKTMQAWPLERKIRVSQSHIMKWYGHWGGKVYVSFSGGKDSTVLLDLARRVYPDIEAVFYDTGLEYPEIREFVKTIDGVTMIKPKKRFDEIIKEYGYPAISKDVSSCIYYGKRNRDNPNHWAVKILNGKYMYKGKVSSFNKKKWKFMLDAPFEVSDRCCYFLKKSVAYEYEKESGKLPIIGMLAVEGKRRKASWMKNGCNAFDNKRPKSNPLSFWEDQDILKYLKITGIPHSRIYGDIVEDENGLLKTTGADRTGCMFCMFGVHLEKEPNRFQRMRITHPKQYDYCVNKLGCGAVLDYIGVKY